MDDAMHLDASKPVSAKDRALLDLHQKLRDRRAPKAGAFTTLDEDARREYFRVARRRSRANAKAALTSGKPRSDTAIVRDALADAALMLLAVGGPGADQVRHVLATVFAARPGVPLKVEQQARSGKLRPKLIGRNA